MPTALDNGRRSPRKLLADVARKLLGRSDALTAKEAGEPVAREVVVEVQAEVMEVLADGFKYVVRLDSGNEALAFKSRALKKRVFSVGDRLTGQMSPYDLTRVRIIE